MEENNFLVFNLSASEELGDNVCKILGVKKGQIKLKRFMDGEIYLRLLDSVRNKNVYVIQSTSSPANDNLMELLIFCDTLRRASVKNINVIIPYFGYARQDRISKGREPITAKIVSKILEKASIDRVIFFDIHANQIQGFFDIPTDNVRTLKMLSKKIRNDFDLSNAVVLSPDLGSIKRANVVSEYLDLPLAIISKKRIVHNDVKIEHIIGNIEGKDLIIIDDMIDTGNTLLRGLELMQDKINSVIIAASHGIFSKEANLSYDDYFKKFSDLKVKKILITNSINQNAYKNDLVEVIDISPMIANLIEIIEGIKSGSFTDFFNKEWN